MIELILQLAAHALAGLVLGAGWALLILSTRAFSRYQTPGWLVLACAGIAFLATLGVGTFVVPHADAPRLAAVAVAVVAGSQAARIIRASLHARDVHTELLLPDSELNRRKLPADRYILVVGANGSGKSAVVSGLLKALGSGGATMGGSRSAL